MLAFSDTRGRVRVAFTDRSGGVSGGPFASLNLAATGHDDPAAVAENLRRVVTAFAGTPDAPVAAMHQVHGAAVVVVADDPGPARAGLDGLPEADGLATSAPGVTLMVRAADCLPVLLADPAAGVVAALHAGRRGLAVGIVERGVATVRALAAARAAAGDAGVRLVAWLGPRVCGGCYEVPAPMREEVAAAVPESWATTRQGTPALDLAAGAAAQLRRLDVEVVDVGRCTREDAGLYSHRRDGADAGRAAGLIRVAP